MKTLLKSLPVGVLAVSVFALAGHAGKEGVSPEQPVFIPPFTAVPLPPSRLRRTTTPPRPGDEVEDETEGETLGASTSPRVITDVVEQETTNRVSRSIQGAGQFCALIPESAYHIDCLSERLGQIAAALPQTGDYAEARAALDDAARKLNALARSAPSRSLARGRAQSGGTTTSRPLQPVAPEALPDLRAQALAIVEEAETILLRSAENSQRRRSHYQQMAAAVDSNKVLLRSL